MESKKLKSQRSSEMTGAIPKIGKWDWDLETGNMYWSDELFRIFGLDPQSFVPTLDRGLALLHADDKEIAETAYRRAVTYGEEYCIEKRIVKHDGGIVVVLSIGTVLKDQQGKIIRILDIFQDITETQKIDKTLEQTVEDLKARNEFIETVIECIPIGIAVNKIDDGKVTLVNRYFTETYGWRIEDFTDVESFFNKIYPEDAYRNEIATRIINDIQSGDPWRMKWDNIMVTTSTDEKRVINAKNIPLFDQNLMLSTVLDVTLAATQAAEIYRIKTNQDALINGTPDIIWSVDTKLHLIMANEPFVERVKTVTGKIIKQGDDVLLNEFGKERLDKWQRYYERALNGEQFSIKEELYNPTVQTMQYSLISLNPMFDEKNILFGVACYSKDITAENLNLLALENTRAKLEKIMDSSLDMICSVDEGGRILNVSAASEAILGYKPEELIGKNLFDYIYAEDLEKTERMAAGVMAGIEMTNNENRYVRKDGSLVPLMWSARFDPKDKIRYGVARDATERKKIEDALIESEKKYKYLFENNPLPILMWDFETLQIIDGNQAVLNAYGYTRDEFLQLTAKQLRRDEDIPILENTVRTEESYGNPHHKIWRHKKKSGEIMYMDVTGHLINYNGRRVSLALCNDVTESHYYHELDKLEKEILELNARNGKSIGEIIGIYLAGIEAIHPGMLCTIQERRGNRLFNLASPGVPKKYLEAIEGAEIGNNKGSCGTAAFLKQKVIVTDIENDIRWKGYKEIAAQFQLRSCWSYPILDGKNNVMATFACYYREAKAPSKGEENTIQRAGNILQIILESYQRGHALEISNERFEYVTKATSDIIWDWNLETNEVYYSENMQKLFGHTSGINGDNLPFYYEHVHPDDRERVILYPDQVKYGDMMNWIHEYRFRKADGEYAFVLDKGIVIRNEKGEGIRMVGAIQDITSRKEEEHRLRLLESVITHASDAVLITEAEPFNEPGPRIVYVNNAFTQMTGYSAEEVIGKSPRILQGPKTDIQELKRLRECIRNWQACETTIINYKKNGDEFWLNLSITPVADEKGSFTHWISIERDVTEWKKTEQALEAAYSEKNTILESIGDAFFAVDQNWVVTYWNNHAERVLMIAKDDILGRDLCEVFAENVISESYKNYHQAVETNQVIHFEDHYAPLNAWFEISAYPSRSGLSVYLKDITERKSIEQRISAERNLLRTLIDNLPSTVYFKDKHARKLISNKVDYELLGAKVENDVLGKTDLDVLPPEIAVVGYEQDMTVLNTGKPLIDHQHSYVAENGARIWLLTTKIPLFDERNETIGMLGIGRDITEQKLAEKKLKELNAELELNIKQLILSNAELEQFAYVASHDLQEPLRMVTSFLTQLEKKYGDVIDDKGKRYINFAIDGAKRMRQLILDLLEFSRVGRSEDDFEEVDFNKLVNEVLALYRRKIDDLKAVVQFKNLPTFQTYKTPLRQVFQNLISNALKYHRPRIHPVIKITYIETKTDFQFSISDNGIGIEHEFFDKIFIIFQRLHNKDEYSGTGMGLAITKKIIENLGGKIWLESAEGNGSTFYFSIPKSHRL